VIIFTHFIGALIYLSMIKFGKGKKDYMRNIVLVLAIICLTTLFSLGICVDESLVLYLPFDEGAGTPKDLSSNPANVAIKGALKWVDGKFSKALEFDGAAANYIEVSHSDKLNGMKALTVEAWVMPYNPDANARAIVSKRSDKGWQGTGHKDDLYNLFSWTDMKFFARTNAQDVLQVSSATVLQDKTWYHVAYTFDGSAKSDQRQNLYVNGKLEMTREHINDSVGKSETSLWIGILNAGYAQGWNGKIDEVKVWKRALSENEVQLSMEGKLGAAVKPQGKLAVTWGSLKP
jgi:hypothetical protein